MLKQLEFFTKHVRPEKVLEVNNGPDIVESAGYITAEQRINNILEAGEKLQEYRKEQYDFADDKEIDEEYMDRTRDPNFDMADVTEIAQGIEKNIVERKKEQKEKEEFDKVKKELEEESKKIDEPKKGDDIQ